MKELTNVINNYIQYVQKMEINDPYEFPIFWSKDFFRQNKKKILFTDITIDEVSKLLEDYLEVQEYSPKVKKAIGHFWDLVNDQIELLNLGGKERPRRELTREGSFASLEYTTNNDTRDINLPSSYVLVTYGCKR